MFGAARVVNKQEIYKLITPLGVKDHREARAKPSPVINLYIACLLITLGAATENEW